ncbi:hypothetical protein F5876DRAFT_50419 [Lentinula aff. lateritia]|uniref:Uncharacterized protein n=1 Tax=Lentinula aff. lateritia TaxID=2804960 RepID=A0ACC1TNJ6_9AGAR|nr:hypothetical protein F5876DRAFT_50419 [Lentinula aff. lateritia]
MARLLTLVSLLFFSVGSRVAASSCVAFDASWNLYAFGFNGKDYNAGTSDSWASGMPSLTSYQDLALISSLLGTASDVTASGRPPFDGANTTCYLSQFYNGIYVLNGDSSNPSNVHIYDPTAKSWTTQTTSGGPTDGYSAVLDHDTNVFYVLSDSGELWFLSFENITTAAQSSTIPWTDVEKAGFDTTNYQPVMALANNHVHFLDVPGVAAGSADIFVIHFSWFQPDPQSYGNFPAQHGQTASIFEPANDGVQLAFAYIPDDGSATYIIDVVSNTTATMAGPSTKDSSASYFASDAAIVQLTSSGAVNYIPYTNSSSDSSASWSTIKNLVSVAPTSSASSGSGSASATKSATGSAASSTSTTSTSSSSSSNGSMGVAAKSGTVVVGMVSALLLGTIALFIS